ncbi:MAG: YceI family protein [Acidimicrobiales bacterium]
MNRNRWIVAAVVIVVVVVVGGYIAIRAVEGGSKSALTLPTVTSTTVVGGTSSTSDSSANASSASSTFNADGTWNVASGSTAGYRVQESLFGVANTAVGRTSAVTGSITISGTTVTAGSFTVDLTKVTSDRSERDQQFQGRIMDTANFPTSTFKLAQPVNFNTLPDNGVQVSEQATGNLTLHGVTHSETFTVKAQRNGSQIQVQGSIPITFSDWNIDNPSGGPATVGNSGTLEFLLNFTHAA